MFTPIINGNSLYNGKKCGYELKNLQLELAVIFIRYSCRVFFVTVVRV